ncbi:MAG: hypothetical protein ABIX10_11155 [Acidimicrobiales bacterium]
MDEQVVLLEDQVFRWEGPKRKQTVAKAKLGRLVLTDRRLLFLSSGSNDLSAGKLLAGGASYGAAVLRVSSTQDMDMSAVSAPGGLEVPFSDMTSAQLKGMFKYLVVTYRDASGAEQASTFSPKNSGMPGGATWVDEIEQRRAR